MQNSSVVAVLIAGKVATNETKMYHESRDMKSVTFTKLKQFVNFMMKIRYYQWYLSRMIRFGFYKENSDIWIEEVRD